MSTFTKALRRLCDVKPDDRDWTLQKEKGSKAYYLEKIMKFLPGEETVRRSIKNAIVNLFG